MKSLIKIIIIICCASLKSYAQSEVKEDQPLISIQGKPAESCCANGSCCNGSQTPLGVMTDHVHPKGEWMVSYSFMDMMMKGNRTETAKTEELTLYNKGYMMAPATMSMQMHMAMLMYGVNNRLTLMAMFGYVSYDMTMNMQYVMQMPGMPAPSSSMATVSSGSGDTKLSALYNFSHKETSRFIGSLGFSLPTGSIKAKGLTMLGADQRLPYDMQPGTGSVSIAPDVTYVSQKGKFIFGVNGGADVKLNYNTLGYRQGNVYHATTWGSYGFLPYLSGSLRAEVIVADKISGVDSVIAIPVYEQFDPTTSTAHYGGKWGNLYAGLNFHFKKTALKKFQFQFEYGMPVYENLNGPQMSVHANLMAGVSYKF